MKNYRNDAVRRQDRLLEPDRAETLLREGEYGVLSMRSPDGGAYGIPVNYVWDGSGSLYIHCAREGRKLGCLSSCPKVSFCIVGETRVLPGQFTTEYESIVLQCRAATGLGAEERMDALMRLVGKYSPAYADTGGKYAEKSFSRTEIIRLDISDWSGKCKRMK